MNDLIMASSQADAAAIELAEQHHAVLKGGIALRASAVVDGAVDTMSAARDDLAAWCDNVLLPHLEAKRAVLYPAARQLASMQALVASLVADHEVMAGLVSQLRTAKTPPRAVAAAYALQVLFDAGIMAENQHLIPALAQAPGVELSQLLHSKDELYGGDQTVANQTDHDCNCGEHDDNGYPELDARVVPHAIRHATVFGALDAVGPGGGMILVAPHDPLPLLAQIKDRHPGVFEVSYLERGPEAWRLQFLRG